MITPVFNTPLLLVQREQRVLVAADIHLGLEYELWLGGVSIPSQTEHILERLKMHVEKLEPDRLVILGDVKHNIPITSWRERKDVPLFLKEISKEVRLEVVPGNHDGGLAEMIPPGACIQPSSGFVLDGIGYFHGHAWPDRELFSSKLLVAGHIHPAVRLKDPLGCSVSRPVWVRAPLSPNAIELQYRQTLPSPEMVIVPAFNDLCGGMPLNEISEGEERGPILTMTNLENARIYLLDGTDLGKLARIKLSQKKQN